MDVEEMDGSQSVLMKTMVENLSIQNNIVTKPVLTLYINIREGYFIV
jgi:hypothetical protein